MSDQGTHPAASPLEAATALVASETSPQEMAFTYEAIRAFLPFQDGDAKTRLELTLPEAFAAVGRMIRQPNNRGLVSWCRSNASLVQDEAGISAFLERMQAVMRVLSLLASMPSPEELSSAEEPVSPSGEGL